MTSRHFIQLAFPTVFTIFIAYIVAGSVYGGLPIAPTVSAEPFSAKPNDLQHGIVYSPDQLRCAYTISLGSRVGVMCDGKPSAKFDEIIGDGTPPYIVFSPDSQHIAYFGRRGGDYLLVIDGVETKLDGSPTQYQEFQFTGDGAHYAYNLSPDRSSSTLCIDGKPQAQAQKIDHLMFSAAGKHVAYITTTTDTTTTNHQYHFVFDGTTGPAFDDSISSITISPDGVHYFYVGKSTTNLETIKNGEMVRYASGLYLDGKQIGDCDSLASAEFSFDSKHLLCVIQKASRQPGSTTYVPMTLFVMLDGQTWPFDAATGKVEKPILSPDGSKVAYIERSQHGVTGRGLVVSVNGKAGTEYEDLAEPAFYGDDNHLVFVAKQISRRQFFIVDNDNEVGPYSGGSGGLSTQLVISPDCKRLAYAAIDDKSTFVVVDGKQQVSCKQIITNPLFSSDSQHVAYFVNSDPTNGMSPADRVEYARAHPNDSFYALVLDGKLQSVPRAQETELKNMTYSPDSQHLAYFLSHTSVVVDGKAVALPLYTWCNSFQFTSDSKHIVEFCNAPISAGAHSGPSIYVDAFPVNGYSVVSTPVSLPNGKLQLFAMDNQAGTFVRLTIMPGRFNNFGTSSSSVAATNHRASASVASSQPANVPSQQPQATNQQPRASIGTAGSAADKAQQAAQKLGGLGSLFGRH